MVLLNRNKGGLFPPQADSNGVSALSFVVEHFYDIVQLPYVPKYPYSNIYNLFLFVERDYHTLVLLAFLLFAC